MQRIKDWFWRRIEAHVNALVTERIGCFHEAMIRRGQITAAPDHPPRVTARSAES